MKPILILIFTTLSFFLVAQTSTSASLQNTSPWTLEQCIYHALEHNIQVQQAMMRTESSKLQVQQAKYNRLPSLSGNMSDGFSFGRSQSRSGVYVDQNSNSANASLNADVNLFQGLRTYYDIEGRKLDLLASIEEQSKIKNDISLNIASLYLNVLIQKELLRVAHEQNTLTDSLVIQVEQRVNNGRDPISKLYEIRAQQANDAYNFTIASKNLSLAILDLAQILEIEEIASFDIVEPSFEQGVESIPIPTVLFENAIVILPDVKAEEYKLESSKKAVEMAKSGYYPSLSFGASTSTGVYYLTDNLVPNEAFQTQLSNNWRSYIGVSMNIPIFNKMSVKTSVSQSKIQVRQNELQIEDAKKTIYKDIQKALLNAKVSKERYAAAEKSAQANLESFRFVEQSFAAGKATTFDLQQSRMSLEKSLSDKIQSKYEFIFNIKVLDFYNGVEISL